MLKIIAAGLAAFVLLFAWVAITSDGRGVQAGDPDCFDGVDGVDGDGLIDTATPPNGPDPECVGVTPTAEPTATAASATPTATAAPTSTAAAGTASPTRTAGPATVTPAAVPGTGGEPGSSTNLLLILALGVGVVAGTAGLAGIAVTRRS